LTCVPPQRSMTVGSPAVTRVWADRGARVDFAAVEHHVERLIGSEPVVLDTHRAGPVEAQRAAVAQLLGAPVEPDIIPGLDAVEVLQSDPEP
jgi:hypothetical protein